jgi:hypothetical protein
MPMHVGAKINFFRLLTQKKNEMNWRKYVCIQTIKGCSHGQYQMFFFTKNLIQLYFSLQRNEVFNIKYMYI